MPDLLENSSVSPRSSAPNLATRRRYAKIKDGADYIGVTERTIRQMIADGRITGYRSGNRLIRVDLNDLDDAMKPFGAAVSS